MGFVELPDQAPPSGGKLQGTIVLDEQELQITVSLLKDALAELTKGMANGVTHASAAAADPRYAPPAASAAHGTCLIAVGWESAIAIQPSRPKSCRLAI